MPPAAATRVRIDLAERLRARRDEIEQATRIRVHAVADPTTAADPTYVEGLRAAVTAALDYGLAAVELGEGRSAPPPPALLAQARLAARAGVPLETVLRRYCAGYAVLTDFLVEEAERAGLHGTAFQGLLRAQAALFDRLLASIGEEHCREIHQRPVSLEHRRIERVERLLAGERLDVSDLEYDLDAHHLAAVAVGPNVDQALRELAAALDRRLLLVPREEDSAWAWFGGRRPPDPNAVERAVSETWPPDGSLAFGQPAERLAGWRLSHSQANAASSIAARGPHAIVHYADVALLASVLRDDLLATSLRNLYLEPLEAERDDGKSARETLGAYFAAERNASSAAAALGISRQGVARRLRVIEHSLGRPLTSCGAELEVALRLYAVDHHEPAARVANSNRRRPLMAT